MFLGRKKPLLYVIINTFEQHPCARLCLGLETVKPKKKRPLFSCI